ncbi:FAD-dependent oxidoreductase [Schaalia sp. 19OD2882]|uniref:FAD-dependent oxidoreductase n=1 Tax=Schaalia sp. 19OD2882 TaxID=2794089 RepID=UPI001C1EDD71|nr:FAD-dependent oxidoreductase [Schaalia sp. 19OD2882]QWW20003.1 FAD-dependent oxidoreductase [Schaalia sp. 19OD2882]
MQVVIVGGVAGGMSCAARLRRLDENASIIVLDKGPDVSVASCGLPYHVGGEIPDEASLRVQTPASLRASLDLDVRTGHEVLSVDPQARTVLVRNAAGKHTIGWDALVLSPGATAARPPIPGIDSPRVHELRVVEDAVRLKAAVRGATRAVVVGGGCIGIEAAENLRLAGLEVTLLEGSDHVLPPLDAEMASLARAELRRLGIEVVENAPLAEIRPGADADTLVLADGRTWEAQVIVVSVGARAETALAASAGVALQNGAFVIDGRGRTDVEGIWAIGDAVNQTHFVTASVRPVQLAGPANRAGRLVAEDVIAFTTAACGQGADGDTAPAAQASTSWKTPQVGAASARELPKPLGTAIVRIGELQVAMTGASKRELERAGIEHRTIHLHPNQHVTYFPGAEMMALVLHFDQEGRILGAQGVGRDGVDRRIDVLSTAMRAGLHVGDLADLDLCYAPPFGAAKDAVMMAGTAAQNVLDGTLTLWYPWQLADVRKTHLILDVRTVAESEAGPRIPGALLVPHTQLRERMEEVRRAAIGRPVAVHCKSGVRSYLAHRMLAAAGLESVSLSGGMLTLQAWAEGREQGLLEG